MANAHQATINGPTSIQRVVARKKRLAEALKDASPEKQAELQAEHDQHLATLEELKRHLLKELGESEPEESSMTVTANDVGTAPAEITQA